jgi:hypothetical protein
MQLVREAGIQNPDQGHSCSCHRLSGVDAWPPPKFSLFYLYRFFPYFKVYLSNRTAVREYLSISYQVNLSRMTVVSLRYFGKYIEEEMRWHSILWASPLNL